MDDKQARAERWRNVAKRFEEIRLEIREDLGHNTELSHIQVYMPLLDTVHFCHEIANRVEAGVEDPSMENL